jgi:N-acetylmuramoyl-L-alanine amidase
MTLPLQVGNHGEEVRDLHRRLAVAGFAVKGPPGVFTTSTREALESFQRDRGLEVTGECDRPTWELLVEAGYRLGDRLVYLQSPMLRGDDIAELQLRLGSLGFDAGRVDGIFGPDTERALTEFQRNAGLPTDGIAGHETVNEVCRLGAKTARTDPVVVVRERERLRRSPRSLDGRRVVVGDLGGLDALAAALARLLRNDGGHVLTLHEPDGSMQAATANHFDAELYLGIVPAVSPWSAASFATAGFESAGGRRLAELCADALVGTLGPVPTPVVGMRLPVLRETRMPAVLCRLGPPDLVVAHTGHLARQLARAVHAWVTEPVADDH